jgi:hypothetical protein
VIFWNLVFTLQQAVLLKVLGNDVSLLCLLLRIMESIILFRLSIVSSLFSASLSKLVRE